MTTLSLKARLTEDMKTALRAREAQRLGAVRLILAAIKQKEVDERVEVDDPAVLTILDKMVKQRRDSITQFEAAGRADLARQERFEIDVLQGYLPAALNVAELDALVAAAIVSAQAADLKDMAKVMAVLRPQVAGRADMGALATAVKAQLGR